MSSKLPKLEGFTAVSDQILVRKAEPVVDAPKDQPTTVVIYGWGDGLPKHVGKYADGFRTIFPHANQIIVLSPIMKALSSNLESRSKAMRPIVENIFGSEQPRSDSLILMHCMSNTGGINYAATLNEYRNMFGHALPHKLSVCDSTPGTPYLGLDSLKRWSRAMALGTAAWFPWPFFITQGIWAVFLCVTRLFERLCGVESASVFSTFAMLDDKYNPKTARKLFLYSKEDDLIAYEDIEAHAAQSTQEGYEVDTKVFSGSHHVGHMRKYFDEYWGTIAESWKRAVSTPVAA